jgi:hypothetical protein
MKLMPLVARQGNRCVELRPCAEVHSQISQEYTRAVGQMEAEVLLRRETVGLENAHIQYRTVCVADNRQYQT